jgi:hypothetical protein
MPVLADAVMRKAEEYPSLPAGTQRLQSSRVQCVKQAMLRSAKHSGCEMLFRFASTVCQHAFRMAEESRSYEWAMAITRRVHVKIASMCRLSRSHPREVEMEVEVDQPRTTGRDMRSGGLVVLVACDARQIRLLSSSQGPDERAQHGDFSALSIT